MMIKYLLTFIKFKTKIIATYSNGQFKRLEYKSGGLKQECWDSLSKAIPLDEHHIKAFEEKYDNRIKFEKIEPKQKSDFKLYLDVYFQWFEYKYKFKPKWSEVEGKALKKVIAYLQEESTTNEEALIVWEQIFTNWYKLDKFYKEQHQLRQINSNLAIILTKLKDGTTTNKNRTHSQRMQNADDIVDAVFGEG